MEKNYLLFIHCWFAQAIQQLCSKIGFLFYLIQIFMFYSSQVQLLFYKKKFPAVGVSSEIISHESIK